MFTYGGRFCLILFLGSLVLSTVTTWSQAGFQVLFALIGACTFANAIFNGVVVSKHPGLSEGVGLMGDIAKTERKAKGADAYAMERGTAYAADNPDLAAKAAGHAVDYAVAHPDQAAAAYNAHQSSGRGHRGSIQEHHRIGM